MKRLVCLASVVGAMLFSGCESDLYYQDRAVRRAREYVLKNAPELTSGQRDFVEFNAPVLLYDPSSGSAAGGQFLTRAPAQICVTWVIPERPELYMVVGFSTSRMSGWRPYRLIRRELKKLNANYFGAMSAGRSFLLNANYKALPAADGNYIRFIEPEIYKSSFDPEYPIGGGEEGKAEFLAGINGLDQYALVWQLPESEGNFAVVYGYSDPDLGGWSPNSGGIMEAEDVAGRLNELIVMEPEL